MNDVRKSLIYNIEEAENLEDDLSSYAPTASECRAVYISVPVITVLVGVADLRRKMATNKATSQSKRSIVKYPLHCSVQIPNYILATC